MIDIYLKLFNNPSFLSAFLGLLGTVLIFIFGIPPKINKDGAIYLILEQKNQTEIEKYKIYKSLGYLGLFFILVSYFLQVIISLSNF